MTPIEPVDIILLAGAKGTGKTRALASLLEHYARPQEDAVLISELGNARLAQLLGAPHLEGLHIRELLGGCVCCSAEMTFRSALIQTLRRRPRRIWVEVSGDASVASIRRILGQPGLREAIASVTTIAFEDVSANPMLQGADFRWTHEGPTDFPPSALPLIDFESAKKVLRLTTSNR